MANTIKVTVVAKDGIDLIGCPTVMHLPCPDGTIIDGRDFWFHSDTLQQTWLFPPQITAAADPAATFPVAYVKSQGHDYYVLGDLSSPIGEDTVNQQVADACNQCCEESPTGEPEVVADLDEIPDLLHMANGQSDQNCSTGDCTYSYYVTLPANSEGLAYSIQFICNGQVFTSGGTTFTTVAAALSWATTNFDEHGTWTLSGNQLKVAGTACAVGALQYTLS